MQAISSPKAPTPIGPYSQGVKVGNLVFCSGQLGIDRATGELAVGIKDQTRRSLQNIEAVLRAAGSGLHNIVRTTVFLADLAHFADMNSVYAEFFREPYPARTTVPVARLPREALVVIDAIAATE